MSRGPLQLGVLVLAQLAWVPLCAADDEPEQLQEVVVTAQKRTENVQKVPAAVTPVSGDTLVSQGITDVRGLGQLVPGINLGQDYIYTQVDIRGVGANNDAPALDPAVAFNIDGVYQARDYGTYGSFYDIDRVEVLRGPQGTLYGRNATGGSINVITNKPVEGQFAAASEADFDNYFSHRVFAMVNLPATDDLAVRLAGQYLQHDGYLTSGFNDEDSNAARLQALYKPSSDLSLLVAGDYFQDHNLGAHTVIGLPFLEPNNPWYDPATTAGAFSDFDSYSMHSQLDWTFSGMTLTEIPAFKHVGINSTDPVVGVYATTESTDKSYSNELRLASAAGVAQPLTWVSGLYFFKETDYYYSNYFSPYFSSVTTNPDIAEKSWALFGQATYAVLEHLRVTGGVRYSDDSKTAIGQDQVFIPGLSFPVDTIPDGFAHTWHHVDWKVGVDADVTPTSLAYASISTGYLEGGFNLGSSAGLLPNFQPETLTSYAVGTKNRLFDNSLQVNAEAFYYDYKNYIVSEYLTQGPAAGNFALYNAARSRFFGGEIESRWLATEADEFTVNLALLQAHYTDFTLPLPSNGLTNLSGFTAMKAPGVEVQAGYQHTWQLGRGSLQAGVQTHYSSSYWTLFDHTSGSLQPAYTKTNVVVGYFSPGQRWHIQAYANNLENAAVIATAAPPNSASGTVPWVHLEEPRVYGIRIGASF